MCRLDRVRNSTTNHLFFAPFFFAPDRFGPLAFFIFFFFTLARTFFLDAVETAVRFFARAGLRPADFARFFAGLRFGRRAGFARERAGMAAAGAADGFASALSPSRQP